MSDESKDHLVGSNDLGLGKTIGQGLNKSNQHVEHNSNKGCVDEANGCGFGEATGQRETNDCDLEQCNGRDLDPSEWVYEILQQESKTSIYVHIALLESDKKITKAHFENAFNTITMRHPVLRMRIDRVNIHKMRYLPMNEPFMNLKFCTVKQRNDWVNVFRNEQGQNIDSHRGPLWRVVIADVEPCRGCYESTVMLFMHHAIADAVSVFDLLYRQLLPVLNHIVIGSDVPDELKSPVPLGQSVEQLFLTEAQRPVSGILRLILNILRWKNRTFSGNHKPICCTTGSIAGYPDKPRYGDIYPLVLTEELTTRIINGCKQKGVTVHAFLLTVASFAICESLRESKLPVPKTVVHGWPVNLRKEKGIPNPQPLAVIIGNGRSSLRVSRNFTPGKFWKATKVMTQSVRKQVGSDKMWKYASISQYIMTEYDRRRPLITWLKEFGFISDIVISNLGRCDVEDQGAGTALPVRMVETYFTVCYEDDPKIEGIGVGVGLFQTCLTFFGKMMMIINYPAFLTSREFIELYAKNTIILSEAALKDL